MGHVAMVEVFLGFLTAFGMTSLLTAATLTRQPT